MYHSLGVVEPVYASPFLIHASPNRYYQVVADELNGGTAYSSKFEHSATYARDNLILHHSRKANVPI